MNRTTIAPVRLSVIPDGFAVLDHGEMVAVCPNLATAMRVRDLVDMHGLVAVPDDLAGMTL